MRYSSFSFMGGPHGGLGGFTPTYGLWRSLPDHPVPSFPRTSDRTAAGGSIRICPPTFGPIRGLLRALHAARSAYDLPTSGPETKEAVPESSPETASD